MTSGATGLRVRLAMRLGLLVLAALILILPGCDQNGGQTTTETDVSDQTTLMDGEPITEADIRVIAAPATAFSPEQIVVVDYENFGDWAAAHIVGNGEQDTALALFKREGSKWTLFDLGTGLSPSDIGPDAPAALVDWAFH